MDYLGILEQIFKPEVGSLWKVRNNVWVNGFAGNRDQKKFHPSIVERIKSDNVSVQLAPGTSKKYEKGSCVFRIDLNNKGRYSYFLLKLSMPFIIDDLKKYDRGWDGTDYLNDSQLKEFEWQIKICKG